MPAEGSGDVGVALGLAELGVPQDLLYGPDADALVEQQGRGRVACIVDPGVRRADECTPVFPVVARVDRRAEGRAEDEVPVFPGRPGGEAFRGLLSAVSAELVDERGRKRQDEFGLALTGFDSLSAGEVPATADASRAFPGVRSAANAARPFHLWARMATSGAVGCTVVPVPVPGAAARARHLVPAAGTGGRILASMPEPGSPELPADFHGPGV